MKQKMKHAISVIALVAMLVSMFSVFEFNELLVSGDENIILDQIKYPNNVKIITKIIVTGIFFVL